MVQFSHHKYTNVADGMAVGRRNVRTAGASPRWRAKEKERRGRCGRRLLVISPWRGHHCFRSQRVGLDPSGVTRGQFVQPLNDWDMTKIRTRLLGRLACYLRSLDSLCDFTFGSIRWRSGLDGFFFFATEVPVVQEAVSLRELGGCIGEMAGK